MEKYEIRNKLGVGAHGSVFLVHHSVSKRLFALKKIEVDERKKSRSRESVLKEASILSQLKHPHIVLFHESFWNPKDECVCIILDYCGGGNLADQISTAQKTCIPFTERQIMQWFIQVIMAVQYIHSKHILHRDLKSENVFLNKRNVVKVGDFGISKVLSNTIDVAKTVVGTPSYLSPELCQDIPYNSKSDIWAIGCLLYELCSLNSPFDGYSLLRLMSNIVNAEYRPLPLDTPEGIQDLVAKILIKQPENRPSASALLNHPYVKENIAAFISDTESILYERGKRPPVISWIRDRKDKEAARPQSAPPKKLPPLKTQDFLDVAPVQQDHKENSSLTLPTNSQPFMRTLPEPVRDNSKARNFPPTTANEEKAKPCKSDDPSYYSDDFDESSSDSEIEEDLSKCPEDKVDGKSEDELYADDFEECDSDEGLDALVAQARQAQEVEPGDEYFLEPEDELGLSQTLAIVQAELATSTSC